MIIYKDFTKLMESRGYILRENSPITLSEYSDIVTKFDVEKMTTGKFLEIKCPENTIMSICGNTHEGGCEKKYHIDLQISNGDEEPFQGLHYSIPITKERHVVAEIIVTKVMQKEPDKNDPKVKDWMETSSAILNIVRSENPFEYPMWTGVYKIFNKEFLNLSYTMYPGEKFIFYAANPEVDIKKVRLTMDFDVFEKKENNSQDSIIY